MPKPRESNGVAQAPTPGEYQMSWPRQFGKDDVLVAVKRKHGWVVRVEPPKETETRPWLRTVRIEGQDLLGFYKTKRATLKVIAAMEAARNPAPQEP